MSTEVRRRPWFFKNAMVMKDKGRWKSSLLISSMQSWQCSYNSRPCTGKRTATRTHFRQWTNLSMSYMLNNYCIVNFVCVCASTYARSQGCVHVRAGTWRSQKSWIPGAGITGNCGLSDMKLGTWVFCWGSMCSNHRAFPQPPTCCF